MSRAPVLTALFAIIAPVSLQAQGDEQPSSPLPPQSIIASQSGPLLAEVITSDLDHPWGLALLPDGSALVTQRNSGGLLIARRGDTAVSVDGVPEIFRFEGETSRSQAGLFDVKLHPEFASNQLVYLSLSAPTERGASLRVIRGRLVDAEGQPRLDDLETIFDMAEEDQDSSGLHFGGRMAIDPADGSLFLTVGERRNISRSQDPGDQAGSVLRMTLDGAAHPDNPSFTEGEANEYLFAMGSRNSQALTLDQAGRLWSAEHGPLGGDRVDLIQPGSNLGWPFITGGRDYSEAPLGVGLSHHGMQSPLHVFEETVAPSGAAFYQGPIFGDWQDNLLIGGLYNQSLVRLAVDDDRIAPVELVEIGRRVRDVAVAPDGAVWMITDHADGELIRLSMQ